MDGQESTMSFPSFTTLEFLALQGRLMRAWSLCIVEYGATTAYLYILEGERMGERLTQWVRLNLGSAHEVTVCDFDIKKPLAEQNGTMRILRLS